MSGEIHQSKVGTYHPAPFCLQDWTIDDTRGYLDAGPTCDECGACECGTYCDEHECIGLSFAFVCLDGGETLCSECAEREGITIVPCNC